MRQRTGYARLPVREGEKILGVVNVYEILFEGKDVGTAVRELMTRSPKSETIG